MRWLLALLLLVTGCAPKPMAVVADKASAKQSTAYYKKYVWIEINTYLPGPSVEPWVWRDLERYAGYGYECIVTTSPGYSRIIYPLLPDYVIPGIKFANALPKTADADDGWQKIYDDCNWLISQGKTLIVLELETYLNQYYWYSPEPAKFRAMFAAKLAQMPKGVRYLFYPAFGEDVGIPGWSMRLKPLLNVVDSCLDDVRYTDSEYGYKPPNPTWSPRVDAWRTTWCPDVNGKVQQTWTIVYTTYFTRPHGFNGWPVSELPHPSRPMILYPAGNRASFEEPLDYWDSLHE